ncbi:MAG: hypothetical protein QXQ11_03175, partial [Candidatus Bathyarchaeia archaeon]
MHMRIGLLTRNRNAWCSQQLIKSFKNRNVDVACFSFGDIVARVGLKPIASVGNLDLLTELDAILVRPIG